MPPLRGPTLSRAWLATKIPSIRDLAGIFQISQDADGLYLSPPKAAWHETIFLDKALIESPLAESE